jgi:hypothetical protein
MQRVFSHRSFRRLGVVAVLGALLPACAAGTGVTIDTESAPGVNFAGFHSYRWRSPARPLPEAGREGQILDWRIRTTTEVALAAKGYVLLGSGPVDLLADYQIVVRDKQTNTFREYAQYKQRGGDALLSEAYVQGYQEGTLILELYDRMSNRLVWRATASAVLGDEPNPDRLKAAIHDMISRLPTS